MAFVDGRVLSLNFSNGTYLIFNPMDTLIIRHLDLLEARLKLKLTHPMLKAYSYSYSYTYSSYLQ